MKLPLEFEINQGQFAPEVLYLARSANHYLYVTRDGLTLALSDRAQRGAPLRMTLPGADPHAVVTPENRLPGVSNYLLGSDRKQWRQDVPHFGSVRYRAVWPGIDLVLHGRGQDLEYDFAVSPGADPSAIRLRYANASALRLDKRGNLVVPTASGDVLQRVPEIYQEIGGKRRPVRGAFRVAGDAEVQFELAAYDHKRMLIIDPTVTYSTYIGSTGTMTVNGVAVDASGNMYVGGYISSADYPTVTPIQQFSANAGLFHSSDQGGAWSSASSSIGSADVLSLASDPTRLGVAYAGTSHGLFKTTNSGNTWTPSNSGMANSGVLSISVDPLSPNTIYACQSTDLYKSVDAANTWRAIRAEGCTVVAADPKTEGIVWQGFPFDFPIVTPDGGGTFYGTFGKVVAHAIAIDPSNSSNVFFGADNQGLLVSNNGGVTFTQITSGLAASNGSSVNVNAISVDPRNTARVLVGTDTGAYLSLTAGTTFQSTSGIGTRKVLSILFDPSNDNIALAGTAGGGVYRSTDGGQTWTADGPANLDVPALTMSSDGSSTFASLYTGTEAFVTKINSTGSAILYSTYLGGSGTSQAFGLAVDNAGHAFLCGSTTATDFPTQNPYQQKSGGGTDFFVSRLSASGSSLDASTFLGGHANDICNALALDPAGNVYVAGTSVLLTSAAVSDFPATSGVLGPQSFGGQDCVVAKFDNTLKTLIYSTFLGGANSDSCYAVAADASGNAYVTGSTFSSNFLVTGPPFGGTQAGGSSSTVPGFVAKIKPDASGLIYSGLLGGAKGQTQISGIAVDRSGRAYVTGFTSATDYPLTTNAINRTLPTGLSKTLITAIETDGSKLVFSTLLPGAGVDGGQWIALDAGGTVWVTGGAYGDQFPVTADAFPIHPAAGIQIGFLAAVDSTGSKLLHATYLGGASGGTAGTPAIGSDGSVYVAGTTLSTDYTQSGALFQKAVTADSYLYLMRLNFSSGGGSGTGGSGSGGSGSSGSSPVITSVQNGASFQNGFAANSWMTIKGTNLASVASDTWANSIVNGQLPTTLDGVSVSVGGQPAYVYFVSPEQINVVAPNLAPGPMNVTVTNSLGTSAPFSATAQADQPALFLWTNSIYTVATRQDFSYAAKNGTFAGLTTVPAKPGDVIILWGTGFGPTTPAAPVGVQLPANAYTTATPVTVTVGGAQATVYGAALAPGFAALYQIAIQIPTTLADGDYPVIATVGGVSSQAAAITVAH